jgi:HPt (histidine-containing phosphotransfer) domain-containing protein
VWSPDDQCGRSATILVLDLISQRSMSDMMEISLSTLAVCEDLVDPTVVSLSPITCDLDAALARMAGDVDLLKKIAEFFREDSIVLIEALAQAVADGNLKNVEHGAHSLKGLAGHFNAEAAMLATERLEEVAAGGDTQGAQTEFDNVRREIVRLDEALTIELARL